MDTFNKNTLLVVSSAPLIRTTAGTFLYKPYEIEMQIWAQQAEGISFCCPVWKEDRKLLKAPISFEINQIIPLQEFNVKTSSAFLKAIHATIHNVPRIFKAMQATDHIHLRCPGNIGLLGCLVQILFPSKPKTAKYAGNWDPKAKQPWSYRLQKWILSNTFLTRNMQVLVYGEWENQSKNIKPFFTATYSEAEKTPILKKDIQKTIHFIFVGTLVSGKNPLYAIQLVQRLFQKGYKVKLTLFGEGKERKNLEHYCVANQLEDVVILKGNQTRTILKKAYQESHFVILPSKSEGWPKAVAEGMFWGCIPIATAVSCVPFMLDHNNRGILLEMNFEKDSRQIETVLNNQLIFDNQQRLAANWSRKYTLDRFENEIKKMLLQS